ncbi:hypothetical protein HY636_02690 [Candidatus Woesearchaeota archaeon]|nr:hypothetical protein [Candidatus Woesearchaeota archaeon]
MESITIKVEGDLAREMNKAMRPYYSTKTEFIREAIRDKLKNLKKQNLLEEVKKNFGKAKTKTPLWMDEVIREEVGKEYAEKRGWKL